MRRLILLLFECGDGRKMQPGDDWGAESLCTRPKMRDMGRNYGSYRSKKIALLFPRLIIKTKTSGAVPVV
jgi:hypothetical protein